MNIRAAGQALATGTVFALNEVGEAAKNDPALAMRMAATSLSDSLLKKVNDPIKDSFDATVVPVVRGGILALNGVRAVQTFKDPDSTGLDKFMDVTRVASDLVGFVGGLAVLTSAAHADLGRSLMGFSYAVDAVSHAYRGLNHGAKRIKVWQRQLDELKEENKQKPQEPPQNPQQPKDPKMRVTIEGPASVTRAILQGDKPRGGTDVTAALSMRR